MSAVIVRAAMRDSVNLATDAKAYPMSSSTPEGTRWVPDTPEDKERVTRELNAILGSEPFHGSKRYPAMLKYVVGKTLNGRAEELKERTLGVDVFDRPPTYDTNADPVVRFCAGEIRKRLAQYYHAHGDTSDLQIRLPLGTYVPEFKPKGIAPSEPGPIHIAREISDRKTNRFWWWGGAAVLCAAVVILGAYVRPMVGAPRIAEALWSPILRSPAPVLIVVATSDLESSNPQSADAEVISHFRGPYHHVTMSTAIALARLAGFLQTAGKSYQIKDEREVSLTDFRSRPVVLIGARNNRWTMRLTEPLRFHFDFGSIPKIQDRENPDSNEWSDPRNMELSDDHGNDYALIARYYEATTGGVVMVIAGLGTYGSEAASEFVVSPQHISQFLGKRPGDWKNQNLEIVIRTEKVRGEAGPPVYAASTLW